MEKTRTPDLDFRCAGCDHRWPEKHGRGATLCGDCWRKAQPLLHAPCVGRDAACPCQDGDTCHYLPTSDTKAMTPASPPEAPAALVALVREWQEARKPTTLAAPGEFLAEAFQSAVRRMSAADEALAAYRLDGASDDVYGPLQAVQPDGRRAPDAVALSGVPTDAGDARPAAALSLRDELAEIIRWRFCAAAGEIMDGVKMLKAAQEIADAIAPMIEEATGAR